MTQVFTGTEMTIQIGVPGASNPTATYGSARTTGGLKLITAITNEPGTLVYVPATRSSDIHPQKSSERIKLHGAVTNDPGGEIFETFDGAMGSIQTLLHKDSTNNSYYHPSIELMLQKSIETGNRLYIKMMRYIGDDATILTGDSNRWHVKASLFNVRSDNATLSADVKAADITFTLEGSNEYIEGYMLLP